ncbi:MAG: orotate phosphoribosyltransferase [Bacteroidetes bacterium]|nr:orotate phosphoribosyltransferase [Bacteroidota bacterium]
MTSNETGIAERLLQVDAVKLNINKPFTWASGWKSPIYCDNRRILSFPYERDYIKSELCSVIFEKFSQADCIAGVATAGIAWGAMAADQLKLPYMYVRSAPKEHGMGNLIEGAYKEGSKVLVVEDLISTGKSSLKVCSILQDAGLEVVGMVSIFNYGFEEAKNAFEKANIPYYSLSNYEILINLAKQKGLVSDAELKSLLNWRTNPANWNV